MHTSVPALFQGASLSKAKRGKWGPYTAANRRQRIYHRTETCKISPVIKVEGAVQRAGHMKKSHYSTAQFIIF